MNRSDGFGAARALLVAAAVTVALLLQISLFPHWEVAGVVPNLVLVVVVAAGLLRGSHFAMVLGFAAGVLLDLAPPADHVAGRWALALLVVGYVAGRVRAEAEPGRVASLVTVAACSFLGSSVFALSGLVLRDPPMTVPDVLHVVLVGVVWDVVAALAVLPLMSRGLARLEPHRVGAR